MVLDSYESAAHLCPASSVLNGMQSESDCVGMMRQDKTRQFTIMVVWLVQVDFSDEGGGHHQNIFKCVGLYRIF